jgi:hypothetical protein
MDRIIEKDVENIMNYIKNISWGDFILDYLRCKNGLDIKLDSIYMVKNVPNDKVELINVNGSIVKYDKNYKIDISLIKSAKIVLIDGKEIVPFINVLEYIKQPTDLNKNKIEIVDRCNSTFWKYYFLTGDYMFYSMLYWIRQYIYNFKNVYLEAEEIQKNMLLKSQDILENTNISLKYSFDTVDIRSINKYLVDHSVLKFN